jgi:hypothetical protein
MASPGAPRVNHRPSTAAKTCRACGGDTPTLLDVGRHAIANRFLSDPGGDEPTFPLELGQCRRCGLIQLMTPVPVEALISPYDWIRYREPEMHLDTMVDVLRQLPGISTASVIAAVTYKDDSTLERFARLGFSRTWRLDPADNLGITAPQAGIESIQDRLTPERARRAAEARGPADLVIIRHVIEHAYDLRQFTDALLHLVKPDGYLVFEAPDCTLQLKTLDYTMVWEEHVAYFTPETLTLTLAALGLALVRFDCHPYPYENSLVAVVRPGGAASASAASERVAAELERGERYAAQFEARRAADVRQLDRVRREQGRIAMFGAGHLACMYLDLMGSTRFIDFVIDDHPAKRNLFMPGSRLSIRSSDALLTEDVALCLMSLSPESEEKVVARQVEFQARGGVFASIFPASRRALRLSAGERQAR